MSTQKVNRQVLLPPYLEDSPAWSQLLETIDEVFGPTIDDPTRWLSRLRDTWIMTDEQLAILDEQSAVVGPAGFETLEKTLLVRQANLLGFDFADSDLLTSEDYQRIVRNLALYWYGKGTPQFVNFLGFVLNSVIQVRNLWATPGATWDTYGPFVSEGDPSIGTPVWEGGPWFPTTHVEVQFDPFKFGNLSQSKLLALFYAIANYNLVIERIILDGELYLHSRDNEQELRIVSLVPMWQIDEVVSLDVDYYLAGGG